MIARLSGNLLGTRLILNEFVAFVDLGKIGATLDPKSFVIATYALCGFANLSSVAIQVGGIGALAPSRKSDRREAGHEGGGRGNDGELHVGVHRGHVAMNPIGVVLGSGLGAFADTLQNRFETPYADIAGWPASTAVGHAGKLVTGRSATWKWWCSRGARIITKATRASRSRWGFVSLPSAGWIA